MTQQSTDRRKFQINPGPLRIVPARQRRPFAKPGDLTDVGQCDADLRNGSGRCLRDGVETVDDHWLCRQHANLARRTQADGPVSSE
jgi:hypothetical protein